MKRIILFVTTAALLSTNLIPTATAATKTTVSFNVATTPSAGESIVTFYGQVKPAAKAAITINSFNGVVWNKTSLKTTASSSGSWKITTVATAIKAEGQYQAIAVVGKKKITSKSVNFKVGNGQTFVDEKTLLAGYGPGGRIHGSDISRWQHPNDKPIDFKKKFDAGMRFVLIKGSDSTEAADIETLKWLVGDRNAAQAAGLYTGMYHFAYMPDSTDLAYIQRDAKAQAQKVIWRLASLGGYNEMDLPVALDLENNCVKKNRSGNCVKYLGRTLVTAWAETWLQTVEEKTGRKPFIYSYPQFLESSMVRSETLRQYPLWLAQYGINPADPIAQPGLKEGGCYVHSWTTSNCSSQWIIWQYSSCGIATKYGVPGSRLDLNVFRGTPSTFLDLIKGAWVPEVADQMPKDEPSSLTYKNVKFSSSDKPINLEVDVIRPDGRPVVTGTVRFYVDSKTPIEPKPVQTVVRSTSGSWKLSIKGVPAGIWSGNIGFKDATGTHADSRQPISFSITEGDTSTPSPSAKPSVTPSKKPATDGCKNQIKN